MLQVFLVQELLLPLSSQWLDQVVFCNAPTMDMVAALETDVFFQLLQKHFMRRAAQYGCSELQCLASVHFIEIVFASSLFLVEIPDAPLFLAC